MLARLALRSQSRPVTVVLRQLASSSRSMSTSADSPRLHLPRLPIPSLRDTLNRYLESIEPLLLEDEASGGPPLAEAMRVRASLADEFESGVGKLCQERLQALDKASPYNWLDDNFWLNKAYLEWRAPLLINSNWWLAYMHDPTIPTITPSEADLRAGVSAWQVRRAAWLLKRTLDFKERLESQDLYPDTTRTGIWMHNTVPRMFNVCRVPQLQCDRLTYSRPTSPYRRKVLISLHDWIYAIDVCDSNGKSIGHQEIEQRLRDIVVDAETRLLVGEVAAPIGILTADDRDNWARNRERLLSISPANKRTMDAIEDSILMVNLDHYTHITSAPSPSELKSHLHNIRSGPSARNRWFDKGISLIVENNGRAGMMGEHSPVDALVPSIVADYSLAENIESDSSWPPVEPLSKHVVCAAEHWERLDWSVDERIFEECKHAEERARALIADSDDDVCWFTGYGTEWIKNVAKLSSDAYIQMAMQLAWFRTRGSFTATYETALTRLFQHGRTETIRTLTSDSRKFVLAMCDDGASPDTKSAYLRQAIAMHGALTKAAMTGKGIDRHLLGLRLVMQEGESSPLFDDWAFAKSQEWKLSTSGLSAGLYFRGTGFGTPYSDGYGINYLAGPESVKFGIESKFSCRETSTELFGQAIMTALEQMKAVIIGSPDTPIMQSRL